MVSEELKTKLNEERQRRQRYASLSKKEQVELYFELAEKFHAVYDRLLSLVDKGICKSGALLAYDNSFYRNKINCELEKDILLRRTTRKDFAGLLVGYENGYLDAKKFVEEAEL